MKKFRKVLTVLLVVLVVLIGALLAIPVIYKKDIVRYIQDDLNKSLKAEVSFDEDISLGLISSFPKLNVGVNQLLVKGQDQFASDTLFYSERIKLTIDLMELISAHKVEIGYLELLKPSIHLISTPGGVNWDIVKDDSTDDESNVSMSSAFKKAIVTDARFSYTDTAGNIAVDFSGITGNFSGSMAQDSFDLVSSLTCNNAFISYENIPYINNIGLKADAITALNLATDQYYFKENSFWIGDLLVTGKGGMSFDEQDNINFDINYASPNASFAELMSLIPAYYRSDMEGLKATGNANLEGSIKGLLSETSFPGYDLSLNLTNGRLEHQSLTTPFENVNLDLLVQNPDGADNSLVIDLKKLDFLYQKEPVSANMLLKTLYTDPYIDGSIKGKVRLEDMMKLANSDEEMDLAGNLDCDLAFKGFYSSVENEKYDEFSSTGHLTGTNISYKQPEYPQIDIAKSQIDFTSHKLTIPVFDAKAGKSDLLLSGFFDNMFGYMLNDESLHGSMTLSSNYLDLNEFNTETSVESSDSGTYLAVEIPANLDVRLMHNIRELKYDNYTLKDIAGNSRIADQTLKINQLTTRFLDGTISFNGLFKAASGSNPFTDIQMTVQDLNIQEVFKRSKTLKILAPVAEYVSGMFSSSFHLKTTLLDDLSPDLKNITCEGVLDLLNCNVEGLKSVSQMADKLQYDELRKPFKLKDLLLNFSILDGKIQVNPFDLPIGETILNIGGYSTLDKSLHFNGLLTVPKELYASDANGIKQLIPANQLNKIDSIDYKNIELAVNIGGQFLKPKVTLAYSAMKKGLKDQLKSRVSSEVDKRKQELQKKATDEMNRAKAEADKARQEAEEEARRALEEQKRKMQEQVDREKEAAKKKAQEELEKKKNELIKNKIPKLPK